MFIVPTGSRRSFSFSPAFNAGMASSVLRDVSRVSMSGATGVSPENLFNLSCLIPCHFRRRILCALGALRGCPRLYYSYIAIIVCNSTIYDAY